MHTSHFIPYFIAAVTAVLSCTPRAATDSTTTTPTSICFEDYFLDKSMRLDFYHCGNSQTECYFFDELKEEPYYAGSHIALRDSFNYGNQRFVLLDKETGQEIYSFHYCTLWNEWSVNPEAKTT